MSNTKKNAGCINCEHYQVFYDAYHNITPDICNSSLTVKKGKVNDYRNGYIQEEYRYIPHKQNKNLTCKGFTPIDWKKKYDNLRKGKVEDLESTVKRRNLWLIFTSGLSVSLAIITLVFIYKLGA